MFTTIIDRPAVMRHLDHPKWIFVDCRFDLAQPDAGFTAYLQEHVPQAVYAHLDHDLSGPPVTNSGRHPLPVDTVLAETLGRLGVGADTQVVTYDSAGGSICARFWWLLKYMGHEAVAVMDGGWAGWKADNLPTATGEYRNAPAIFKGKPRQDRIVTVDDVTSLELLVDARDPARYRGEIEPIDPVAGHIPGAINCGWRDNLQANGDFAERSALRQRYQTLFGATAAEDAVFYCGSGVTACHDLLAACHAGYKLPRLYAGSWSEWCKDTSRPVATGAS